MNKNNTALFIIILGLVIAIGVYVISNVKNNEITKQVPNLEVRDGVQYITITAKSGYTPEISNAKADIPTKLVMNTEDTFDCSSVLVIPSLKIQKNLPQNGETVVDIGTHKADEEIQGLCGMGMYNFMVTFS